MNCPSRTEEPFDEGYNQNPPHLSSDLTTAADLNGIVNKRMRRTEDVLSPGEVLLEDPPGERAPGLSGVTHDGGSKEVNEKTVFEDPMIENVSSHEGNKASLGSRFAANRQRPQFHFKGQCKTKDHPLEATSTTAERFDGRPPGDLRPGSSFVRKVLHTATKFLHFVGPGFMVSVAYIDPGNYSTDVAAGASYRFKLLFVVLLSNVFAAFLQSLCIKLGTVTGMNLAENCRAHCPKWLNICLYILAEVAIIATDIAEVIGTAIALNLLSSKIPLVAGCALSILDVFLILVFYRPNGSLKGLQAFEMFVAVLVLAVVVSFCLELSLIKDVSAGEVFRGYLPSGAFVQAKGLYQACGILGATVMPHSLYLGSGIVKARLAAFDIKSGFYTGPNAPSPPSNSKSRFSISIFPDKEQSTAEEEEPYRPSLGAINHCLKFSTIELCLSLCTFALFVNSAILIVSGASLSSVAGADGSDIFGIHNLLSSTLSPAAGIIFALALLLSGISAGVVCTIAGQMVSEGALNWTMAPWARRLVTRSISITPSIIIAGAVGRSGLNAALNGTQVILSLVLPFVSAPLIWFTARSVYMGVWTDFGSGGTQPAVLGRTMGFSDETGPGRRQNKSSDGTTKSAGEVGGLLRREPLSGERVNIATLPQLSAQPAETQTGRETARNHKENGTRDGDDGNGGVIQMRNHWVTTAFAVVIWLIITALNVANLVLLKDG